MHTAHVIVTTTRGSVGAHFSRYFGKRKITIPIPIPGGRQQDPGARDGGNGGGGEGQDVKFVFVEFPIGSDYSKLMARDDEFGPRITPGHGWNQQVSIPAGTFVLDLADWDDDPNAYVELHIDGEIVWEATGTGDNYRKDWNIHTRGKNVAITDDREIAIVVQD